MKTSTLAEPTFVGRTNELSGLVRFLESMIKGEGSTIFISGEAGSGKTRLLKEFLEIARNKGASVLSGWCLSNAAVPYFPFVEAFNSLESSHSKLKFNYESQQLGLKLFGTSHEVNSDKFLSPQIWKDRLFDNIAEELLYVSTLKKAKT